MHMCTYIRTHTHTHTHTYILSLARCHTHTRALFLSHSLAHATHTHAHTHTCKHTHAHNTQVPGAWELPLASRYMAMTQKVDAIVPIGVLIKGDTDHYDMIKDATTAALMDLQVSVH